MAEHRRHRIVEGLLAAAVAAGAALGCASVPSEVHLPPQTLTEAPTSTVEQEAALVSPAVEDREGAVPAATEPHAGAEAGSGEGLPGHRQTIVIQSANGAKQTPRTLQEASTSERQRRAATEAPVAVITNKNLGELAEGGQLTVIGEPSAPDGAPVATAPAAGAAAAGSAASGGAPSPPPAAATAPPGVSTTATGGAAAANVPSEEYWRSQALMLRLDWKAAVEAVDELSSEVQDLRRRFYAEDDPFYRDNQIKPAWDRKLDLLAEAKTAAEEKERKLARFLDEGRRSGALPGWLREGVEFEPPPTPDHTPAERRRNEDPWEPKVLHEEPRDP
jgi:hypothetical protein